MKRKLGSLLLATALIFSASQLRAEEDALTSGFTLKLAYILPNGNFGDFGEKMGTLYQQNDANWGLGLQLGTIFYLDGIDLGEQFKLGIDVTWMSFNFASTSNSYSTISQLDQAGSGIGITNPDSIYRGNYNAYHAFFYPEVGPCFGYTPAENMALEVAAKLTPMIAITGGGYTISNGEAQGYAGFGAGLGFTPSFYFRYGVVMIGVEHTWINMNHNYRSTGDADFENIAEPSNYNNLRIVLGFKF